MSVFEIEGTARRAVPCDVAIISITFKGEGNNPAELSQKVMQECDDFLEKIAKSGMNLKNVRFDQDRVADGRYRDANEKQAIRSIRLRIPFDMKLINEIQSLLYMGKYSYELVVTGDISNRTQLKIELAKEALNNSKKEAEELAETLELKLKGVDSIRKDRWDDGSMDYEGEEDRKLPNFYKKAPSRTADNIGVKVIEESTNLKVRWILE